MTGKTGRGEGGCVPLTLLPSGGDAAGGGGGGCVPAVLIHLLSAPSLLMGDEQVEVGEGAGDHGWLVWRFMRLVSSPTISWFSLVM